MWVSSVGELNALTQMYRAHSGGGLVAENRPRVVFFVPEYLHHVLKTRGVPVLRHLLVPALPRHATSVSGFVQLRVLQMEQPAARETYDEFHDCPNAPRRRHIAYGISVPTLFRAYRPVGVQRIASGREVGEIDLGLVVVRLGRDFGRVEHARLGGHV